MTDKMHEYLNENTGDNDWTQPELFRSTTNKPSNLDKELGNAHIELMRAKLKNQQMQDAMNKAIYKLCNLKPTNANFNKQIDDIIAILEG